MMSETFNPLKGHASHWVNISQNHPWVSNLTEKFAILQNLSSIYNKICKSPIQVACSVYSNAVPQALAYGYITPHNISLVDVGMLHDLARNS